MRMKEYFELGQVYNREYFSLKGQSTIQIISINGEKIQYQELYCPHPTLFSDDLRGNPIHCTFDSLIISQDKCKFIKVEDISQYYIHSQWMSCLQNYDSLARRSTNTNH